MVKGVERRDSNKAEADTTVISNNKDVDTMSLHNHYLMGPCQQHRNNNRDEELVVDKDAVNMAVVNKDVDNKDVVKMAVDMGNKEVDNKDVVVDKGVDMGNKVVDSS